MSTDKNAAPKISIIVPVYNVEKYLRRCLDSIRAQTFTDFECICVDDGSSDGSGKILDEYAEKDGMFRVIHQANAGVSAARNAGLDVARGEYVCFVDADDYIAPKTFAFFMNVSDIKNIDMFESSGFILNEPGDYLTPMHLCYRHDCVQHINSWKKKLLKNIFSVNSMPRTILIRRSIIENSKIRYNENFSLLEDVGFVFDLMPFLKKIMITMCNFYFYRKVENSLTHKSLQEMKEKNLKFFDYARKKYKYDKTLSSFCNAMYLHSLASKYFDNLDEDLKKIIKVHPIKISAYIKFIGLRKSIAIIALKTTTISFDKKMKKILGRIYYL